MEWKENQFEGRKVVQGMQQLLLIGQKKWAGDCLPCPIGSVATVVMST